MYMVGYLRGLIIPLMPSRIVISLLVWHDIRRALPMGLFKEIRKYIQNLSYCFSIFLIGQIV
jgi:hypothetical protein